MIIMNDFLRFGIVGVVSSSFNFCSYVIAYSLGLSLFVSSILGYTVGMLVSYNYGRTWVFGKTYNVSLTNIILFTITYAVGGVGMAVIINTLNVNMGIDYKVCWFFGLIFSIINNFFGMKYVVFGFSKRR